MRIESEGRLLHNEGELSTLFEDISKSFNVKELGKFVRLFLETYNSISMGKIGISGNSLQEAFESLRLGHDLAIAFKEFITQLNKFTISSWLGNPSKTFIGFFDNLSPLISWKLIFLGNIDEIIPTLLIGIFTRDNEQSISIPFFCDSFLFILFLW